MNNTLIIYEKGTESIAGAVSSKMNDVRLLRLDDVLKDRPVLNAKNIGIFSNQEGKGVSGKMIGFVRDFLPEIVTENTEYLFSVCVGMSRPYHSLKIIERLCMKNGIAPSFNYFVDAVHKADVIKVILQNVKGGEVRLAYGSYFTRLYMLFRGIK